MKKCILLFSGGLDSVVAAHLLLNQGITVQGIHFVLPFDNMGGKKRREVEKYAEVLNLPLRIIHDGEQFLEIMKSPRYGFGKNVNPCIDCRISRLKRAKQIMAEEGADFIATGEVVGQRPMSQRMDKLNTVGNDSGLKGVLLRPLSAGLLEPTIPEQEGWVDRSKLLSIHGRGRKEQLAYAQKFGLQHDSPAGGCLLTQREFSDRFQLLKKNTPDYSYNDFQLLAWGRHFLMDSTCRLVVGRNDADNHGILSLMTEDDYRLEMTHIEGPVGLVRGTPDPSMLKKCAAVVSRYSKKRNEDSVSVDICRGNQTESVAVKPLSSEAVEDLKQ